MKNAIIIHGMPDKEEYLDLSNPSQSNRHWFPWLQKQLCVRDILAQTPEMPEPYEPVYKKFADIFERFEINENTILVGHSCGAGFLIRWLSENKIGVGQVILVAPWLDPGKELSTGFFDFVIDPDLISRTKGLTVFYSLDDEGVVLKTVTELKGALPKANYKEYIESGHFTEGDGYIEFPELLEVLKL